VLFSEPPTDWTKLREGLAFLSSRLRPPLQRPPPPEAPTERSLAVANIERIALEVAAEALAPPPPVDYLAWAERNVVFSERESPSFPGPYNRNLFPYFDDVLRALGPDDPCRIVTLKCSAQIGKTTVANIFAAGSLAMDPKDILYLHPTEDNAERWSKMKLAPLLKNTASLAALFPESTRDARNAVLYKERIDGRAAIQISGANSASSLSQVTMARQVQDDLSKWELNNAGDPETQADGRSRAVEFAKIVKLSTPLVMPGCRITKNFEAGSQERYLVPCPHCGFEHLLEWENMLAELDPDKPEEAHFTCPDCGGVIEEHHRPAMIRAGRWVAGNERAARYHRSFAIWSAYSLLQSWETIAREWLKARGDPAAEQVFLNDTVGEAYQARGEAPPWEEIKRRAEASAAVRGRVPLGYTVLTVGIDCQADRVEWQLIGWGRELRRHVVDVGIVPGHIGEEATRKRLDDLMRSTWPSEAGRRLALDRAAIDGNAWTEDVWEWSRRWPAGLLMMVRGASSDLAPRIQRVRKERTRAGKLLKYAGRFFTFNSAVRKFALYRNLEKLDPMARGFVGLPRGLEDEWFRQLTAERRVAIKRKDGNVDYRWEKDPGQANEALDTHLQAEVAAEKFGVRDFTEATWDRLEAEREARPERGQLDLEDLPLLQAATVPPASPASSQAPAAAPVPANEPPAPPEPQPARPPPRALPVVRSSFMKR
jgi:phage terminase large subunit GpA-like protein